MGGLIELKKKMQTKEKQTLTEYLAAPNTVSKVTKGSYIFGMLTTIFVIIWCGIRFWKTDYFLLVIPQAMIGWRLWKGYRRIV